MADIYVAAIAGDTKIEMYCPDKHSIEIEDKLKDLGYEVEYIGGAEVLKVQWWFKWDFQLIAQERVWISQIKLVFKSFKKNATRQRFFDAVMEHIYFEALYEEQSYLTFLVNKKDKEDLCDSLELYGFKVKEIPIDDRSHLFENAVNLLISW